MRLFGPEPKAPEKKSLIGKILGFIAALVIVAAASALALVIKAAPRMEKIILSAARTTASAEVDEAVLNYMETNAVTYADLMDIRYDNNGAISSVTADTAKIDALIARMDDEIGGELEEKVMETEVSLNVLLGTEMFSGPGKTIKVYFMPINVVNVRTRHEFVSEGINQTLHTVYLDISVEIEVLLPLRNRRESVDAGLPIGQTLIVGGVPSTYVER